MNGPSFLKSMVSSRAKTRTPVEPELNWTVQSTKIWTLVRNDSFLMKVNGLFCWIARNANKKQTYKRCLSPCNLLGSNELHLFINNFLSDLKSADVWSTCLVVHHTSALTGYTRNVIQGLNILIIQIKTTPDSHLRAEL